MEIKIRDTEQYESAKKIFVGRECSAANSKFRPPFLKLAHGPVHIIGFLL